jgi:membrane protein DedA with SNARE-associated domain
MFNFIGAIVAGSILAVIGIFLHNAISPVGLLIALASAAIGISYVGQILHFRKYKFAAALSWLIVVLLAGSSGSGNEVLIIGNANGDIFLVGGAILVTVIALLKV